MEFRLGWFGRPFAELPLLLLAVTRGRERLPLPPDARLPLGVLGLRAVRCAVRAHVCCFAAALFFNGNAETVSSCSLSGFAQSTLLWLLAELWRVEAFSQTSAGTGVGASGVRGHPRRRRVTVLARRCGFLAVELT